MKNVVIMLSCALTLLMADGMWVGSTDLPVSGTHLPAVPGLMTPATTPVRTIAHRAPGLSATIPMLSVRRADKPEAALPPSLEPPTDDPSETLKYDGPYANGIGLGTAGTFWSAVRFSPVHSCSLKSIVFYQANSVSRPGYVYLFRDDGGLPDATPVESVAYTNSPDGWQNKAVSPILLPSGADFWLAVKFTHANDSYPAGADDGPLVSNREFISFDAHTDWEEMPLPYNWNLRAVTVPLSSGADDMMAVSIDSVTSPLRPNQWVPILATVRNAGTANRPAGVPVKFRITGPSAYLYEDLNEITLTALAPNGQEQIAFAPNWRTPNAAGNYLIRAWTDLAGDQNRGNDTTRFTVEVTNWLTYADWSRGYWITWQAPERAVYFAPGDFNVSYPLVIESIKHEFFLHTTARWPDSSFRFKIYAGNMSDLLYASPAIEAVPSGLNQPVTVTHGLGTPLTITDGPFIASVAPVDSSGHPSSLADDVHDGRSIYGDSTSWYFWDLGEFHTSVFVTWAAPDNDVGFTRIEVPWTLTEPGEPITPTGLIRNYGLTNQPAIPCSCIVIDSLLRVMYAAYLTASVDAGDTVRIVFDSAWTPPPMSNYYQISMQTFLPGDGNRGNDAQYHMFFGFHVQDPLTAALAQTPPTIDGRIETGEWADAYKYDISNVMGWNDPLYIYYPTSVWLYAKHDTANLYLAADVAYFTSSDSTEFGLYFDDNDDGNWAGDSTEGNYWALHRPRANPVDSIVYRSLPTNWRDRRPAGCMSRVSYSAGHQQYEVVIPIGDAKAALNASPSGDTVGFYCWVMSEVFNYWPGYWNTRLDDALWNIPSYYGKLVLSGDISGITTEPGPNALGFALQTMPNPVTRTSRIRYSLPRPGAVSVRLYDLTGSLINTLTRGHAAAGIHDLHLDASKLARGIYVLKFEAEGYSTTRKLVIE